MGRRTRRSRSLATRRGSSSRASGLPRHSVRIRSRTRGSSRPGTADASSAAASSRPKAADDDAPEDRPARGSSSVWRTAKTSAHRLLTEPRPTNSSVWADVGIEPLGVVHHADHGLRLGDLAQQRQDRQTDQEAVRWSHLSRARTRAGAPGAAAPAGHRSRTGAVGTAGAGRRMPVGARTPRRPPGRSGIRRALSSKNSSSADLPDPGLAAQRRAPDCGHPGRPRRARSAWRAPAHGLATSAMSRTCNQSFDGATPRVCQCHPQRVGFERPRRVAGSPTEPSAPTAVADHPPRSRSTPPACCRPASNSARSPPLSSGDRRCAGTPHTRAGARHPTAATTRRAGP